MSILIADCARVLLMTYPVRTTPALRLGTSVPRQKYRSYIAFVLIYNLCIIFTLVHSTGGWTDTIHRNMNCASYTLNWATKWLIRFICFSHAIKMYQVCNLWYIFLAGLQGSKCYSFPLVHCNGECSSLRIHNSETTYPGYFKLWNVVINIILNE